MALTPHRVTVPAHAETVLQLNVTQLIATHPTEAYRALQQQVERPFFACLMQYSHGNKTQAARLAGLDVGTLSRYLDRYGIVITKHVTLGGQA
jgi:DNA-binding protein Fis